MELGRLYLTGEGMTKEELVHTTLKQLTESFKLTPENFKFEDPATTQTHGSFPGPTIIWQFKVKIDEGKLIADPLNSTRTIIVTYNKVARQLSCMIYHREVNNFNHAVMPETQASTQYHHSVPLILYRTYREFANLKESLIRSNNEKEFMEYMKKFNQIFPSANDEDLFK